MAMTFPSPGPASRRLAATAPIMMFAAGALALVLGISLPASAEAQPARGRTAPAAAPPAAEAEPTPHGIWIDHTGRGAVEIGSCAPDAPPGSAQAAQLCGRIIWMKEPNDDKGQPLRDVLNKNAARRGQPICGLQIIGGLQPQTNGTWDKGWIYDPEQGSSFDLEIRLRSPETLQVKGYMGVKFLSETFVWRRAKEPPPRCPGI